MQTSKWSIKQYENLIDMYKTVQRGYDSEWAKNRGGEIAHLFPLYNTQHDDYPNEWIYDTTYGMPICGSEDNMVDFNASYNELVNAGFAHICLWHNHRLGAFQSPTDILSFIAKEHWTCMVIDASNYLLVFQKTDESIDIITQLAGHLGEYAIFERHIERLNEEWAQTRAQIFRDRYLNNLIKLIDDERAFSKLFMEAHEEMMLCSLSAYEREWRFKCFIFPKHLDNKLFA